MIRRKTNRRHMIGDHYGRTARRATLLVRAMDEILGTHRYARVSTKDQFLDRQITALTEAGCIRIFADKKSGKNAGREELWKALDYLREGDTLVVPSLDGLGSSLQDLIAIVGGLRKRGIGFRSLKEALDTTTSGGRLVFHVFAALAEFIRELIIEGINEGLAAAKARGQRLGLPPAMTPNRSGTPARCARNRTQRCPPSPGCWASAAPRSTSTCPNSSPTALRPSRSPQHAANRDQRPLSPRVDLGILTPTARFCRIPAAGVFDLDFVPALLKT